ncbi:MAG: hypothetical protein AAFR11_05645 [Pseudomonadota bacterium]
MATTLVTGQITDFQNTPVSGALINFFAEGTTTPRNSFTDDGLGTANANPVVADSDGRFVAWIDSTLGNYKIVVTNPAASQTFFNQDSITPGTNPVLVFYPAGIGDQSLNTTDSVTFNNLTLTGTLSAAGLGLTPANAAKTLGTDDAAVIQTTIDSAPPGGSVKLDDGGFYQVESTLTLDKVSLIGRGTTLFFVGLSSSEDGVVIDSSQAQHRAGIQGCNIIHGEAVALDTVADEGATFSGFAQFTVDAASHNYEVGDLFAVPGSTNYKEFQQIVQVGVDTLTTGHVYVAEDVSALSGAVSVLGGRDGIAVIGQSDYPFVEECLVAHFDRDGVTYRPASANQWIENSRLNYTRIYHIGRHGHSIITQNAAAVFVNKGDSVGLEVRGVGHSEPGYPIYFQQYDNDADGKIAEHTYRNVQIDLRDTANVENHAVFFDIGGAGGTPNYSGFSFNTLTAEDTQSASAGVYGNAFGFAANVSINGPQITNVVLDETFDGVIDEDDIINGYLLSNPGTAGTDSNGFRTTGRIIGASAVIGSPTPDGGTNSLSVEDNVRVEGDYVNVIGGDYRINGTRLITASGLTFDNGTTHLDAYVPKTAFTPTLTFATPGDLSVTYDGQTGRYMRVGDLVVFWLELDVNTLTHSTASGAALISGPPITASSDLARHTASLSRHAQLTLTGLEQVGAYIQGGTQNIKVLVMDFTGGAGSTSTSFDASTTHFASGTSPIVTIQGSYFV